MERLMRRYCLAACSALALSVGVPWAQQRTPGIAFEVPVKDFGKVYAGETLVQVFNFSNRGDAVLEIAEVRPT